jgi:hypothetical protein
MLCEGIPDDPFMSHCLQRAYPLFASAGKLRIGEEEQGVLLRAHGRTRIRFYKKSTCGSSGRKQHPRVNFPVSKFPRPGGGDFRIARLGQSILTLKF